MLQWVRHFKEEHYIYTLDFWNVTWAIYVQDKDLKNHCFPCSPLMYSKLPDNNNTFLSSFFEAQLCNMCSLYIEIQFPQKSCKIASFSINRNKITMVYSSVIYSSARQLLTGKSHTKYQVCLSISKACDATENEMIASCFFFFFFQKT